MGFTRCRNPDEMKEKTYKKRKLGTKDTETNSSGSFEHQSTTARRAVCMSDEFGVLCCSVSYVRICNENGWQQCKEKVHDGHDSNIRP